MVSLQQLVDLMLVGIIASRNCRKGGHTSFEYNLATIRDSLDHVVCGFTSTELRAGKLA